MEIHESEVTVESFQMETLRYFLVESRAKALEAIAQIQCARRYLGIGALLVYTDFTLRNQVAVKNKNAEALREALRSVKVNFEDSENPFRK